MTETRGFGVTLPADLLQRIDLARGRVPRSRWLGQAAEARLGEDHALRRTFEEVVKRVEALELAHGKDDSIKEGSA